MTGADYLAKSLQKAGSDAVFGVPSYVGMKIIGAFKDAGMKVELNTHEQNGAHMAEGYYNATGKVPIVSVAIGPGLTNAVTGIVNAYIESVPMIVVAARAADAYMGRNEYHSNSGIARNLDERQMMQSCTKQVFYIDKPEHIPTMVKDAIRTATTGRPGPVYISMPISMQVAEIQDDVLEPKKFLAETNSPVSDKDIAEMQSLYAASKKPLFIFGQEVRPTSKEAIATLLEEGAPFVSGYGAKGSVPDLPNNLGTVFYCNSGHLDKVVAESDLVLVFGEHFSHFSVRAIRDSLEKKKVVHVSSYIEEIGRPVDIALGIHANPNKVVESLVLEKKPWKHKTDLAIAKPKSDTIDYISRLGDLAPGNAVFYSDVGNAGYCGITELELKDNQLFYTTGKFGVCGYSIGTAIGHGYANPDQPAYTIIGDFAFQMNMQEVANVKKFGTTNVFLVFNNNIPQNIAQDQELEIGNKVQVDVPQVDYKKLAESFGLKYVKIDNIDDWQNYFKQKPEAAIVEIVIPDSDRPLEE